MKRLPAVIFLSFFYLVLSAQKISKKNLAYTEFGGNGLVVSANYERQIINYPAICLHAGAGFYPTNNDGLKVDLTLPFGINYLLKFNKFSMLDIGFGIVYTKADPKLYIIIDRVDPQYVNNNYISLVPAIGYRHYSKNNFMWRGSITPVINKSNGLIPFIGFSIGKLF